MHCGFPTFHGLFGLSDSDGTILGILTVRGIICINMYFCNKVATDVADLQI
jgi:hypothetical protein